MITIHYCAEGEPVPDFNYKEWIERVRKSIKQKKTITYQISTIIPMDAARLEIAEDRFPHNKIQFMFEGVITSVDECGTFCKPIPEGIGDIGYNMVCAIHRAYRKKGCKQYLPREK